jgi:hypothetical protein
MAPERRKDAAEEKLRERVREIAQDCADLALMDCASIGERRAWLSIARSLRAALSEDAKE